MKCRIFNLLAALSLVLSLAMIGLWVRSYWREERVQRLQAINRSTSNFGGYEVWDTVISTSNGGLRFAREHDQGVWFAITWSTIYSSEPLASWDKDYPYWGSSPPEEKLRALGFQYIVNDWLDSGAKKHSVNFLLPLASPMILFGIAPAAWAISHVRQRRRSRKGHCRKCGYDLRASKDPCPECGTAIAVAGGAEAK